MSRRNIREAIEVWFLGFSVPARVDDGVEIGAPELDGFRVAACRSNSKGESAARRNRTRPWVFISRHIFARSPAATITDGLEVFVQEVIAAITTVP